MPLHLVTGGSGYLGSNIARLLVERGERVRILDLWKDGTMPPQVETIIGDINDQAAVRDSMIGVDYVHHNVALVPLMKAGQRFWLVNVDGTQMAVTEASRANVKMFCHMSSSAIFGRPRSVPITNASPTIPVEQYGRAKLAAEDIVKAAGRGGLPVSIIRPRTIVGPGRLGIFGILFEWIRDNANVIVMGSGNNRFQLVHVDDVSHVSIKCCLNQQRGVFNAGAEKFGTLRSDLEALIKHAGSKSKIKSVPATGAMMALAVLDKLRLSPLGPYHYLTYGRPFYFELAETMRQLEWTPAHSNVEILCQAYDWYLTNKTEPGASPHKSLAKQRALRLIKWLG